MTIVRSRGALGLWAESSVPPYYSDLLFWFDPSDDNTLTLTGSRIDNIADKAPAGEFEIENVSSAAAFATGTFPNGRQCINAGGSGVRLRRTDLSSFTSPRSWFCAYDGDEDVKYLWDSNGTRRVFASDNASRNLYFRYGTSSAEVEMPNSYTSEAIMMGMSLRASEQELRVKSDTYGLVTSTSDKDTSIGSTTTGSQNNITPLMRQNDSFIRSQGMGEFLAYAREMSASEMDEVIDYLVERWN